MADRENSNLGEEIQDIVQNAVSTMDFEKLNSEISTTVNTALSEVRQALGIVPVGRNELEEPKPGTWRPVGPQRYDQNGKQLPPPAGAPRTMNSSAAGQREPGRGVPEQRRPAGNPSAYGTGRASAGQDPRTARPPEQARAMRRPGAGGNGGAGGGQDGQPGKSAWSGGNWRQTVGNAVNTQRNKFNTAVRQNQTAGMNQSQPARGGIPIPYVPVGNVSGTLCTVFGSLGSVFFGIAELVMFIMGLTTGEEVFIAIFTGIIPFIIISALLARRGNKIRSRLRRMRSYMKVLQVRGFSSVKELANSTGSNEKFVRKDLRKMLSLGMFPEGQLDDSMTCFMATRQSCDQYWIAQNNFERRDAEEKARQAEVKRREARLARYREEENIQEKTAEAVQEQKESSASETDTLSPEVREAIRNGKEYMRQIRETNDAIPEKDISEKLERLELVTDRIFYHVEKHPEQLPEIRKFMDYYLPTTLKLLKAYQEFESQPFQGDNIKTAKREIRNTLDTINIAFENLLDSLFEDAAMDVSTDISVLQTMLKQEGLTGSEFEQATHETAK